MCWTINYSFIGQDRLSIKRWLVYLALLGVVCALAPLRAGGRGDQAIVIYNRRSAESKSLAQYYAKLRDVPAQNVFGLDLPVTESISRADFKRRLQAPLLKALESKKLFVFSPQIKPATSDEPGSVGYRMIDSKIRYAVLCYEVPVRISPDTELTEEGAEKLRPELRRNEAAVDSELALLPLSKGGYNLYGPLQNPFYMTTNSAAMSPQNGLLLVGRLDGPSAAIARSLVDKAIQAENDGLWGRAYFDARGVTNGNYKLGDDWIRGAAAISRRLGFETFLDEGPATFAIGFPMSQIALYAGWYDTHVSGPFTRPKVEFMPGAIAYHLHSFSAHSIRTADKYWVGPLLAKGATATMGCVVEPYLEATPNVAVLFDRLLRGFTFGEAAWAAQPALSWQTTIIGDPLYWPFNKLPQTQHAELAQKNSKLIEWSHLRVVNLNLATGVPAAELISYLENQKTTLKSAVLQEKLGDLYAVENKLDDSIRAFENALELDPTPMQSARLMLILGRRLAEAGRTQAAYETFQKFVKEFPDYPELESVYKVLLPLAEKLGRSKDAEQFRSEISRLAGSTGTASP